jgi:hypothetical protein
MSCHESDHLLSFSDKSLTGGSRFKHVVQREVHLTRILLSVAPVGVFA